MPLATPRPQRESLWDPSERQIVGSRRRFPSAYSISTLTLETWGSYQRKRSSKNWDTTGDASLSAFLLPSSLPPHRGGLRIQTTREIGCEASEGETESKGKKTLDLVDLQKHYLFLTWEETAVLQPGILSKPQDWSQLICSLTQSREDTFKPSSLLSPVQHAYISICGEHWAPWGITRLVSSCCQTSPEFKAQCYLEKSESPQSCPSIPPLRWPRTFHPSHLDLEF